MSSAPRQGLNPRQAETVERLLAAGDQELREAGVDGLTVRTVAHRAGVSPATAYTYLSSKNHLFAELFLRLLTDTDPPVPTGHDAVERVQSVIRQTMTSLGASPELAAGATLIFVSHDTAAVQNLLGGDATMKGSRNGSGRRRRCGASAPSTR